MCSNVVMYMVLKIYLKNIVNRIMINNSNRIKGGWY